MQSQVIINTAALKQVPSCEYFPAEAVKTNILGAMNIVGCISDHNTSVETVVCISTDKAAKPVNVMGMTKAVQERVFLQGSFLCPKTRFVAVRYGCCGAVCIGCDALLTSLCHDQLSHDAALCAPRNLS